MSKNDVLVIIFTSNEFNIVFKYILLVLGIFLPKIFSFFFSAKQKKEMNQSQNQRRFQENWQH
jgi:hypothetical protein